MSNNENWNSYFGFAGPHTTFHHQHFQMVDLMMMQCKCTMNGLNSHELPHELEVSNTKLKIKKKKSPRKGEKAEQQQSRVDKLMTGYDFGWKMSSMHKRIK